MTCRDSTRRGCEGSPTHSQSRPPHTPDTAATSRAWRWAFSPVPIAACFDAPDVLLSRSPPSPLACRLPFFAAPISSPFAVPPFPPTCCSPSVFYCLSDRRPNHLLRALLRSRLIGACSLDPPRRLHNPPIPAVHLLIISACFYHPSCPLIS